MIATQTFTEVYEILQYLGENYIQKLPPKLYDIINLYRDKNSLFEIDASKSIEEQELSEESLEFIAYMNLEYWCNEEERKELIKEYKKYDLGYQNYLSKKYDYNKIFNNNKTNIIEESESKAIIPNKQSLLAKIKKFLKSIFNR